MAKISGITIAINADTSGVTSSLKDLTAESVSLSKQLKTVDNLLKLSPENTELLTTKQELLAKAVEASSQKLEALNAAQDDVKAAAERGDIGTEQYLAFQKELVQTENRLRDLQEQEEATGDSANNLSSDVDSADSSIRNAAEDSSSFAGVLSSALVAGAQAAISSIETLASVVSSVSTAIIDAATATSEYGDTIDKTSQKLGISAEAYQEWDFILQHSGSDISKMSTSMKTLANAVQNPSEKTAEAFERIGISMQDAAGMSQEDLFAATIAGLQKMESGTERTALATDLLGKTAMDLGPLLNTTAEDTEAMRQQVHDLGGVMSDEAVKACAQYQDSLLNMNTAISGVKREISGEFMPSLSYMMDGIASVVSGDSEGLAAFDKGFDSFLSALDSAAERIADYAEQLIPIITEAIAKNLPQLVRSASRIVKSLADSIMKNFPLIISAGSEIVSDLVKGIIEELPSIVEAGLGVIVQLADGITQSLPELIPTIVHIALEIVDVLTRPDTLSTLIDASIAIIIALADGLIEALPELIERAPEIIDNLVTAIVDNIDKLVYAAYEIIKRFCEYLLKPENVDKILTAAMDIVVKIAKGITDAIYKITQAVREIAEEIADMLGWGDYWRAGQEVIDEFMGGVADAWNRWQDYWENIGERVYDLLHPNGGEVDISVTPNDEPGAATGAYITRPTRLLTGEGGKKEVVLPLEQNTGWADILAAKLQNVGVGGGLIINNLTINAGNDADARDLAHAFIAEVDTELRNYQINQSRGIGGTGWAT